jgi:LysM repeat protein
MSPDKNRLITNLKLAVIALAATMAGCETMSNLNPFDDDEDDMPPPVASSSSSSTVYSASSTGTSAPPAQQQSRMVLVEQAVPLAAGAPDEYIVQVGDTLWDIANTFLRDPWYWPEVWYVNPQVENPHLIYPGDVLALVTIDGQQRITTKRAGRPAAVHPRNPRRPHDGLRRQRDLCPWRPALSKRHRIQCCARW